MRIDHVAYRVKDRQKTAEFFIKAFGYRIQEQFPIPFGDGDVAQCIALEPPEKLPCKAPWVHVDTVTGQQYHTPPEIFVSDGTPGSIVGEWVAARGGVGGIHHIAYQVPSVEEKVKEWKEKGYAEFSSDEPMRCEGLVQIFTKPSELTGVIYEFIERGEHGFCKENVRLLMLASKNNS